MESPIMESPTDVDNKTSCLWKCFEYFSMICENLKTKIHDFNAMLKQKFICGKYLINKSAVLKIKNKFRDTCTVKTQLLQDNLIGRVLKKFPKIIIKIGK